LHFINGHLKAQRHSSAAITSRFSIIMHDPISVHNFLEVENVPDLPWPAYSADMLPIEHVLDALDRRAQQRVPVPANIQQLRTAIEEWNIPQATINSLINSM
jgi:hypothetical protein